MPRGKKPYTKEQVKIALNYRRWIEPSTGCWVWLGQTNKCGYGQTKIYGKMKSLSRVSLHIYKDFDLNSPLDACHNDEVCNRRDCFNPEHLYAGTTKQNIQDSIKRGTHSWLAKNRYKLQYGGVQKKITL